MVKGDQQTGRRHVQPIVSRGEKPAGYWFKQRGYTDSSLERSQATTTGEMFNQVIDSKQTTTNPSDNISNQTTSVTNRRFPHVSNHISEHDNRNVIQNYGEYFGRGYGKRLGLNKTIYNHDWIFLSEPRPANADRSVTQQHYRGLPPLENARLAAASIIEKNQRKSKEHWIKGCYDDFGQTVESVPSELIYRDDYKRMPVHPWHY